MKIMAKVFWFTFCNMNYEIWEMLKVLPSEIKGCYNCGIIPAFFMTLFGALLPVFIVGFYIFRTIKSIAITLLVYYGSRVK